MRFCVVSAATPSISQPDAPPRLHRWREGGGIVALSRTYEVFPLIDARTGGVHLVTNDAVELGRRAGRYLAVCDTVLLAASLTAPPEAYCRSCVEWAAR